MSFYADIFVGLFFLANIIYCLAYTVTKMIWLRVLTVIAAICTLPYFYFQIEPLWSALFWQSCFLLINVINIAVLFYNSLPLELSVQERRFQNLVFRNLSPREIRRLLAIGEILRSDQDELILGQGQANSNIFLLANGKCRVLRNSQEVAYIYPGHFIGEMSFVSDKPASADVIVDQPVEYVKWKKTDLDKFFDKNISLKNYFYAVLGLDMADKLRS